MTITLRFVALFSCLLFSLSSGCAHVPPPPRLESVLAQARQARKPVVIEIFTTWCGPCKRFAKSTLPDKEVQTALKDVVFVRYDAERGPGEQVATDYHVSAYPTFLVLDETGAVCKRGSEFGDVSGFLSLLREARAVSRDKDAVLAELAAHKDDPGTILQAARWHVAHRYVDEAFALYEQVANLPAPNNAKLVAEARWESNKLRRFFALRQRTLDEAKELVRRYPGTEAAGKALFIAALSGELPKDEAVKLLHEHLSSLPAPPPELKDDRLETQAIEPLQQAAIVALALHAEDEAQAAVQRLIAARPTLLFARLLAARAGLDRGDRVAAEQALQQADSLAKDRRWRRYIKTYRAQLAEKGTLALPWVDQAGRRVTRYFTQLEGGDAPLDGVKPVSPLLSANFEKSLSATRSPRQ